MPNHPRIQLGRYYHIYNRGNNRDTLFREERNYHYFLHLYARHVDPAADTFAFCLLRNHFHMLVRIKTVAEQTPRDRAKPRRTLNPSHQFGNLFNAYAKAINKAYRRTGSLFERNFERIEVTSERHLLRLVTYIHHNPQKHGFTADFRTWPFSSYDTLCSSRPTRLRRDTVHAWFGGLEKFKEAHRVFDDRDV